VLWLFGAFLSLVLSLARVKGKYIQTAQCFSVHSTAEPKGTKEKLVAEEKHF
jgi:hypothetical protein